MTDDDKSLGDQHTIDGETPTETPGPSSLGDEMTFAGVAEGLDDDLVDDGMQVVDLEERYTIEGVLGKGGMGEVLLATDKRLDRKVAIKRILGKAVRSTKAYQRFLNGAKTIAALNHPNIVQVYDFGKSKDGPFMILECVTGGSLLDKCQQGAIPLEEAIDITCQLCDGIGKAHTAGIVHRDIKPANVLMSEDGVPKLNDFDLAKAETADMGMTQEGAVLGTLDFMPPEQRQDASLVDQRSDLWSLAATLYQMVTGKSPRIIKFNDVPAALHDVLGKALEDEKEDRYQSAREFRDALRASMSAPVPAAVEAVADLGKGQCPECHARNSEESKFCTSCTAALRVDCLNCGESIPVWHPGCGECGGRQSELIQQRKNEVDAKRAEAETLADQYEFDKAIALANGILAIQDPRWSHQRVWAEQFIASTHQEKQSRMPRLCQQNTERIKLKTGAFFFEDGRRVLVYTQKRLEMGRSRNNDIVLRFLPKSDENNGDSRSISETHLMVELNADGIDITDRSRSGIEFNQSVVESVEQVRDFDFLHSTTHDIELGVTGMVNRSFELEMVVFPPGRDVEVDELESWEEIYCELVGGRRSELSRQSLSAGINAVRFDRKDDLEDQESYLLLTREALIGSSYECGILLANHVPRPMAALRYIDRTFWLEALPGVENIMVDDCPVKPKTMIPLTLGMRVEFGDEVAEFNEPRQLHLDD